VSPASENEPEEELDLGLLSTEPDIFFDRRRYCNICSSRPLLYDAYDVSSPMGSVSEPHPKSKFGAFQF